MEHLLPNLADLPLSVDLDQDGRARRVAVELASIQGTDAQPTVTVAAFLAPDESGAIVEIVGIEVAE